MRGLLDGITDPKVMAEAAREVAKREYILVRLMEQTGLPREEARDALWRFEAVTTSEGQAVH